MIQELFGSHATTTLINNGTERNISILSSSSTSSNGDCGGSSSGNNSTNTTTAEKNLRCPRCDSANTKFCYYNNYNLTQPRHFCKTCRRYWTKGGALRNVPIGGGCRKNKATTITTNKYLKSVVSDQILDFHEFQSSSSNPILWSTPPRILTLLRPTATTSHQNPSNPCNVNNTPTATPSSCLLTDIHDHSVELGTQPLSSGSLISQVPINLGLGQNNYGFNVNTVGDPSGLQELYQRLKSLSSSSASPSPSSSASVIVLNNVGYSSSSGASAAAVGGDQMGNWNNPVPFPSWSAADHIPTTTHGSTTAFPSLN